MVIPHPPHKVLAHDQHLLVGHLFLISMGVLRSQAAQVAPRSLLVAGSSYLWPLLLFMATHLGPSSMRTKVLYLAWYGTSLTSSELQVRLSDLLRPRSPFRLLVQLLPGSLGLRALIRFPRRVTFPSLALFSMDVPATWVRHPTRRLFSTPLLVQSSLWPSLGTQPRTSAESLINLGTSN